MNSLLAELNFKKYILHVALCRDVCSYLNYWEYTEQRGALVFIHWCWSNKTEAFEELVGICTGRDTWGI